MLTARKLQLYPMLRVVIMLIMGIITGKLAFPSIPSYTLLMATAACLTTAFFLRRSPVGQSIAIGLTFLTLGAYLITHSLDNMNVPLPKSEVVYNAVLTTEPSVHGRVVQTDLLIIGDGKPLKVRASILRDTVQNRWQRLHVGDGITATSLLEPPHNFAGSTFDYAAWLRQSGFAAETFIFYNSWRKAEIDLTSLSYMQRATVEARRIREKLLERYRCYGADGSSYAVLAAMTLGDKSALSKELREDYSIAGASHVLALSGLHLSIIYTILLLLTFGYRRRWLPQVLIMLAVWSYVVLVGMSASVVRSAVMLTIVSMVTILNRGSVLLNSLSFAAFVMLLCNPLTLYDIGFEMSFMAVLGIAMLEPLMRPRHLPKNIFQKLLYMIWGVISVSIAAQVGTAPLVAYYFGRFSCYFIITNLIVIPCATIILYGVVALAVLSWWHLLANHIASALILITGFMNTVLHRIASLPGASIDGISLSPLQVLAVYIFLFTVYFTIDFFSNIDDRRP
jgi:competence protein ComEC